MIVIQLDHTQVMYAHCTVTPFEWFSLSCYIDPFGRIRVIKVYTYYLTLANYKLL